MAQTDNDKMSQNLTPTPSLHTDSSRSRSLSTKIMRGLLCIPFGDHPLRLERCGEDPARSAFLWASAHSAECRSRCYRRAVPGLGPAPADERQGRHRGRGAAIGECDEPPRCPHTAISYLGFSLLGYSRVSISNRQTSNSCSIPLGTTYKFMIRPDSRLRFPEF